MQYSLDKKGDSRAGNFLSDIGAQAAALSSNDSPHDIFSLPLRNAGVSNLAAAAMWQAFGGQWSPEDQAARIQPRSRASKDCQDSRTPWENFMQRFMKVGMANGLASKPAQPVHAYYGAIPTEQAQQLLVC